MVPVLIILEKMMIRVFTRCDEKERSFDQSEGCLHTVYIGKGEKKKDNMKCSS